MLMLLVIMFHPYLHLVIDVLFCPVLQWLCIAPSIMAIDLFCQLITVVNLFQPFFLNWTFHKPPLDVNASPPHIPIVKPVSRLCFPLKILGQNIDALNKFSFYYTAP